MNQDVSKKLILVLLLLTVIASILSTFTILKTLEAIDDSDIAPVSGPNSDTASVTLSIIDQEKAKAANVAGFVSLDILNQEDEKNG